MKLASNHGNCEHSGFVCPFHGWRWNMDGDSTFVFIPEIFSDENLCKAELALVPVRVELWAGCAFINLDSNAAPLLETLGPIAQRLNARNADKLKVDWWHQVVLPVNWKLALEAFMEGYHVMGTHPQLHVVATPDMNRYKGDSGGGVKSAEPKDVKDWLNTTLKFFPRLNEGMAGMVDPAEVTIAESLRSMELPNDIMAASAAFFHRFNDEVMKQGRARGLPVPDINQAWAKGDSKANEFIFPNFFLLPMFSAMASYRARPLGPESCLFEIWSLALYPEDEKRDPPTVATVQPNDPDLPEIVRQDYSNLPLQQEGLHGGGFEYMRLSKDIEGLISNYHRLIDGFIAGVEPSRLTKATQVIGSGFEAPILDIGF
jgi:phenylpropionate dioxygenase-like ring-hydroxylating dioxygenase large terminal subunit